MAALAFAGAIVKGIGALKDGEDASLQGQLDAVQLRANANNAAATAQREAQGIDRRTEFVASRAQAIAAASGGGASDVSVVNDVAAIRNEGHYQALTRLYNGQVQEGYMNRAADAAINEGNAKRTASFYSAASTVLSEGSDLYSKYQKDNQPKILYGDNPMKPSGDDDLTKNFSWDPSKLRLKDTYLKEKYPGGG